VILPAFVPQPLIWVNLISLSPLNDAPCGVFLMTIHKKILEWQAAHPNITWIGWSIVWAIVLVLLFWPSRSLK